MARSATEAKGLIGVFEASSGLGVWAGRIPPSVCKEEEGVREGGEMVCEGGRFAGRVSGRMREGGKVAEAPFTGTLRAGMMLST